MGKDSREETVDDGREGVEYDYGPPSVLFLLPPHIDLIPLDKEDEAGYRTYDQPSSGGVHTLKHSQNEPASPKPMGLGVSAGKLIVDSNSRCLRQWWQTS